MPPFWPLTNTSLKIIYSEICVDVMLRIYYFFTNHTFWNLTFKWDFEKCDFLMIVIDFVMANFFSLYSSLGMARSRYHSRQKMSSLQISCLSKMKWTLKFRNVYIFKETWVLRVKWVGLQKCIRARECYFRWLAKEWFIGANEASSLMRLYQSI